MNKEQQRRRKKKKVKGFVCLCVCLSSEGGRVATSSDDDKQEGIITPTPMTDVQADTTAALLRDRARHSEEPKEGAKKTVVSSFSSQK